ncbi:MFS general substrate transporter [Annulohypoxylon maeteangense]|uniref:MFS general substrate transporter n=1 Tax=Annulohypoxylon maeteangense TaxID=1927788 RepID=UPI002008E278|nr:MFS general substrate transporter [Annulohypoxylon maeteangense]KAI0881473.1 MFS general substrate transporter [Annulohypoxylon maeteangense]
MSDHDTTTLDIRDEEKLDDLEQGVKPSNNNTTRASSSASTAREETAPKNENTPAPVIANEAGTPAEGAAPAPNKAEFETGRTQFETTVIVFALCSALFLAALDVTIITTAIPTIVEQFNSPAGYTWIGAAYLLANSATVPSWGKISDIWGRKPVLLAAVGIFWIGSLICALSVNIGMLIAARAIQGIGGGGIVVLTNICVGDLFSMRKRGMYYAFFGMVWAIASAIGPILGGVFTSKVTWRWCFYVNLPISGVGFFILLFVLKLHNPRTPVRQGLTAIDWLGSLLIIGGTIMFLFGLEFGGVTYPWNSAPTICLIVFGIVTIGIFVAVEKWYAKYPVIPLRLFKFGKNISTFAICMAHGCVFISGSYYLPLYFQAVLGASSLLSGVYLLPYVLALSFMSIGSGLFMRKTGKYLPAIIFGMFFMTLGFGLFIDLGPKANWAKIIIYQIIAGIGVGPNFQSPLIALQTSVEPRDIAAVTSTFGFVRQLSTSISVVIGGVVFQNGMQRQYPTLLAQLGPELAAQLSGGSAGGNVALVASLPGEQGEIARGAYWNSLRDMYIMYTAISAVGLLVSPFISQRTLSREHQEHKTGLDSLRQNGEGGAKAEKAKEKNGQ